MNKLMVRGVATLKVSGRHADGGGLYLRIATGGARSWVFMTASNGKRAEIGIGPASSVSLAIARRIAGEMREAVAVGQDPRGILGTEAPVEEPAVLTFGAFADQYISSVEDGWLNPVHRQQWRNSLRDHAAMLQNVPVTDVGTENVLAVLQPIWLTKAETARGCAGASRRFSTRQRRAAFVHVTA
ncbi:Arm DNA-binding domain-containing protein [Sphingomonas hankookensis]|uniref:integrase arm-type DNA-binding domain-containing protein n=1 Tax=Sphingomonas hankookensis TaxID=563996 RepID=UPI001F58083B|nr:integrase arm-type DNA-binding domain-containing protein [Sphingomonas hankookensis]